MENLNEFEWCLVGNIIDKHYFGEEKEIRSGNKQFRADAKIYIFPTYGGMRHENIVVIGLPRKKWKMIEVTIRSKFIKNVRLEKIHSPWLKEKISESYYYQNWKKENDPVKEMQKFTDFLNSQFEEITE
ncbi:hypothetical protein [Kaistella sp.]|uniref:hypothetical protein n=1 Tax=Kaistella sp. TaxID=2782235 RepID=UPI003C61D9EA